MRSTLDPTLDVVFKILFARPENRDVLIALLTAVLRPRSPITEVEVVNPDIPKELSDEKGTILDILVRFADGAQVNVEMQARKHPAFRERSLYYWARVYGGQLGRGQSYADLRRVISVLFLGYRELEGPRMHSIFRVLEIHDHRLYSDALEIHAVELPKRGQVDEATRQEAEDLLAWAQFLGAKSDQEAREATMKHWAIAKAQESLEQISSDPEVQELARQRQLALDTYRIEISAARREGASGVLLEQLAARFGDVDDEARAAIERGSEADLERWSLRLLTASSLAEVFAAP